MPINQTDEELMQRQALAWRAAQEDADGGMVLITILVTSLVSTIIGFALGVFLS